MLSLRIMSRGRVILAKDRFQLTINRLCHELIENHHDFAGTCIIGIQPRGILLSKKIYSIIKSRKKSKNILYGELDITFYRDDFRTRKKPIVANNTNINFLVEGMQVILIDDVLFSGRTIQAALSALQHFGRPSRVELLALVDRRFNRHLPIQADYQGITVDAVDEAYVKVIWSENGAEDQVLLFENKESADRYEP